MIIRKIVSASALAGSMALCVPAHAAGSESGTVEVSATLTAACYIGNGTLTFGNITSINEGGTAGTLAAADDTSADTGAIKYVCSNGATANLSIAGLNDSDGQLQMAQDDSRLAYSIYTDSNHSSQVVPGTTQVPLVADGTDKEITLYGLVPGAGANQAIGDYADTLTLTVAY